MRGAIGANGVPADIGEAVGRFAREYRLSRREEEILNYAAAGWSNKEIAARLDVSYRTVVEYWTRIHTKTDCASRGLVLALLLRHAIAFRRGGRRKRAWTASSPSSQ